MLEKYAVSQEHNIYLPSQDYILESYFSQSALWKNLSGFGKFGCSFKSFQNRWEVSAQSILAS